jgi:UDP-3-O-acyl N-acetylglucosamine deacetylase
MLPAPQPRTGQRTLRNPAEAEDFGVHSGRRVRLRLLPAAENSGIAFVRTDLPGAPEIPARSENVHRAALQRMTVLRNGVASAEVGMVEHLLAVCVGLGVDNLRVELDSAECPIFDGSGAAYVRLIREAGLVEQLSPVRRFHLRRPVALLRENCDLVAIPAERVRFTFFAEFRHAGMTDQQVTFDPSREDFASGIAPARTFCFWNDIEGLLNAGLIKGGSTENAIVLKDGRPIKLAPDGSPVEDADFRPRLPNELARHKLLDLMGDLAVLGGELCALISARASGHSAHQEFARLLQAELIQV